MLALQKEMLLFFISAIRIADGRCSLNKVNEEIYTIQVVLIKGVNSGVRAHILVHRDKIVIGELTILFSDPKMYDKLCDWVDENIGELPKSIIS
jgi:hypothetical protein